MTSPGLKQRKRLINTSIRSRQRRRIWMRTRQRLQNMRIVLKRQILLQSNPLLKQQTALSLLFPLPRAPRKALMTLRRRKHPLTYQQGMRLLQQPLQKHGRSGHPGQVKEALTLTTLNTGRKLQKTMHRMQA